MSELTEEIRAKRVAVAKDVIDRIEAHNLKPKRLSYLNISSAAQIHAQKAYEEDADLRSCVDEIEAGCQVCARSALMLSKARLFDGIPARKVFSVSGYPVVSQTTTLMSLRDIFDAVTLDRIEVAFECDRSHGHRDDSREMIRAAKRFGAKHYYSADRCKAVMEKIIEGNGDFIP